MKTRNRVSVFYMCLTKATLSFVFALTGVARCQDSLSSGSVKPAYETETWPAGRQLVWAHPGQNGELSDVANWKNADGSPVQSAPDRNTDIVLPAADVLYTVTGNRLNQVRHVIIEKNAKLVGGHRNEVEIWGNCHVKADGWIHFISIRGDKHTFFRIDDAGYPDPQNGQKYSLGQKSRAEWCRSHISHKFQVCKYGLASAEFIGNFGVSDEVMLQHGKMILSGEFRFSGATGKGAFEIYDGGILEIQSGGRIGPFEPANRKCVYNINVYRNGTIQAGSPERPLTQDAYLLLGFAENDQPGRTGLYSALGSFIRVYSEDPQKARLVISSITSVKDYADGMGRPVGNPDQKAHDKTGITLQLAGDVNLNGAFLDYVCLGGIAMENPQLYKNWTTVTFGPHCADKPDSLFSQLQVNPNTYYHSRGDQASEYGLTVKAVEEMSSYLEQNDVFQLCTLPECSRIEDDGKLKKPVAVVFEQPVDVVIQSKVPSAKIRYTTDGTEPTSASPVYEGPVHLDKTTRLMIKAYKAGVGFSQTYVKTYVIQSKQEKVI